MNITYTGSLDSKQNIRVLKLLEMISNNIVAYAGCKLLDESIETPFIDLDNGERYFGEENIQEWVSLQLVNNISFSNARSIMSRKLNSDPDLYIGYQANVAMCIYDNSKLSKTTSNEIAHKILKLLFDLDVTLESIESDKSNESDEEIKTLFSKFNYSEK